MRIIAGEFGGRKLLPPEGEVTRPITDRVKQSLFDILTPRIPDAVVYDCFAGTGSMGLECLSRGARHVTFFEIDRSALARLNQNIVALSVQDRCRVIPGDLFRWFARANTRPGTAAEASPSSGAAGADIIFLDPPYRFLTDRPDELLQLALHLTHAHLKPGGIVVFRHATRDKLELPNLHRCDLREYGDMTIELLTTSPEG